MKWEKSYSSGPSIDGTRPRAYRSSQKSTVYPSLFRKRYPKNGRTADEQDAYSVARWLEESARLGILGRYFDPPLTLPERHVASLEGWILGVS